MFNKKLSLHPSLFFLYLSCGSIFFVILDQVLKYKIRHLGGFYICNKGISFGFLLPHFLFWLILAIFLLLSVFYLKYLSKSNPVQLLPLLGATLLLSGVFSNVLDRFLFGCVTDFISLDWTIFPLFNPADIFIFVGSCVLLIFFYKKEGSCCV
ncbi:MAG: Lipoprotein signal peptidase [Parcubacteria group bacterium GW2011_GWD2_38_11]|nr:MAG: Lipoprotein signal peptidase [Parcubacteria group bacterium GW2011_GWD2_38_11]